MKRCKVSKFISKRYQFIKNNSKLKSNRRITATYEIMEEDLDNFIDNLELNGNDIAYECGKGSVSFVSASENQ